MDVPETHCFPFLFGMLIVFYLCVRAPFRSWTFPARSWCVSFFVWYADSVLFVCVPLLDHGRFRRADSRDALDEEAQQGPRAGGGCGREGGLNM